MKCPNCDEMLVMAERQGIEIDYCPKCRGVWLDKGELDKIIERSVSAEPPSSQPDPYYGKPDNHHYDRGHHKQNYPYKKRKGFLGDLFDFD
jgi:Zn-finger nucleic acid-binding protein